MRTESHFHSTLVAVLSAALATAFLIACQQSQPPATKSMAPEAKPASSEFFATFEGPWAIVPDPKDPNSVLAIAPKTKSHRFLEVVPANAELDAGVYDLAIPVRPAAGAPALDKNIFQTKIDPQAVQRALDRRTERYVIRLPKPDAYVAQTRSPSRVGSTYPPDASTEQNYATSVALRYNVASKAGFQLTGTPDAGGAFKPLLMELNTPVMRFTIDPIEVHLVDDNCHFHAREAFHDIVRQLGLKLYVDFPDSSPDCRKKDPQLARSEKAQLLQGLPAGLNAGSFGNGMVMPQLAVAGIAPGNLVPTLQLAAQRMMRGVEFAIYFFHSEGGGCYAPIIVGGP